MKSLKVITAISLLFSSVMFLEASDSFQKTRAKQLAKRGKANYVIINNKKDLEKYNKNVGVNMDNDKRHGRKNVINYVEVKNAKLLKGSRGGNKFKRGLAHQKDKNEGINFGVKGKAKSNTRIINIVKVKNSNIASNNNANMGVKLKGSKISNMRINNKVNIKNSKIK